MDWHERGEADGRAGREPLTMADTGAAGWLGYAYAYAAAEAPAMPGCHGADELADHYRPWGGEVRQSGEGFVVYLAKLRRKHHYRYEHTAGPIGRYPYVFAGEGYHGR